MSLIAFLAGVAAAQAHVQPLYGYAEIACEFQRFVAKVQWSGVMFDFDETTGDPEKAFGNGTAFLASEDGLMLASGHVFEGFVPTNFSEPPTLHVYFGDCKNDPCVDGDPGLTRMNARILHKSRKVDTVVLELDGPPPVSGRPRIPWNSPPALPLGTRVFWLGFPFDFALSGDEGLIKGNSTLKEPPPPRRLARLDSDKGVSGGPVFALTGQVVGMVWGDLPFHGQDTTHGMQFFVPIEEVYAELEKNPDSLRLAQRLNPPLPSPLEAARAAAVAAVNAARAHCASPFSICSPELVAALPADDAIQAADEDALSTYYRAAASLVPPERVCGSASTAQGASVTMDSSLESLEHSDFAFASATIDLDAALAPPDQPLPVPQEETLALELDIAGNKAAANDRISISRVVEARTSVRPLPNPKWERRRVMLSAEPGYRITLSKPEILFSRRARDFAIEIAENGSAAIATFELRSGPFGVNRGTLSARVYLTQERIAESAYSVSPGANADKRDVEFIVSRIKDDHPELLVPNKRVYTETWSAPEHFLIAHSSHEVFSQSGVENFRISVSPDRTKASVSYSLTSGPAVDRYRGWLNAKIIFRLQPSE
jgi:hypothetical protein